jgi:hypothetical protein
MTRIKKTRRSSDWLFKTALKIINKVRAYYSSGSRPNQTAKSWGLARLASSVTSGPAAVDFNIIDEGCRHDKYI